MTPPSVKMPQRLPMFEEYIKGGRGQDMKPEDVDPFELEIGTRVEIEHVSRLSDIRDEDISDEEKQKIAQEIALDHLAENPAYYYWLYVSGIADEDITDILDKWKDDDRAKEIQDVLDEADGVNEDFDTNIKNVLKELGEDPESTGFDFDTVNSGIGSLGGKPYLIIRNFNFDPQLYMDEMGNPSKEMAAMSIGAAIKDMMAFDPAEGELSIDGTDVMFPLKENYSFVEPEFPTN